MFFSALYFLLLGADPASLAVVNKVGGAVSFHAADGGELSRVKVGNFPHEAVLSADGRTLYVSDNGVLWMTEDALGTNTISVIDVVAQKLLYTIDLGRFHRPHGLALVGGRLLATTERPYGLILIDPAARKVVRDFDVKGKSPHMVIPAPSSDLVFVSNVDSDSVAAIHLGSGETTVIPTPAHPQGGVFSKDGARLYVTCSEGNQIAIIDPKTLRMTGSIQTGKGPGRIAITPDGKTLVYNLQMEPAAGFADIASGKQVAVVPLSGRPLSLTLSRDGKRAYTGLQEQDKIVFLSVAEHKIERIVDMKKGSGPDPVIPLK